MSAPVNSPPMEGWQAKPDGVVVSCLHQSIPLLWRGGRRSLTGWLCRVCTSQFLSYGAWDTFSTALYLQVGALFAFAVDIQRATGAYRTTFSSLKVGAAMPTTRTFRMSARRYKDTHTIGSLYGIFDGLC